MCLFLFETLRNLVTRTTSIYIIMIRVNKQDMGSCQGSILSAGLCKKVRQTADSDRCWSTPQEQECGSDQFSDLHTGFLLVKELILN